MGFLEAYPPGSKWSELCFDKLVFPGCEWQARSAADILFLYEVVALFTVFSAITLYFNYIS